MREIKPVGKIKLPPDSQRVKGINFALHTMHGRDVSSDRARYRISWSTNESEVRYGTYHLYYMEHIYLREETGYVRVSKYPDYPDRWVLETLVYAPIEEIPETKNGHYELLYCFQDKKRNYLQPLHEICEIIIWKINNPEKDLVERLEREDERKLKQEIAYFEDVLEDRSGSWLVTAIHDKEAIVVPRNYENFNNVGKTKLE